MDVQDFYVHTGETSVQAVVWIGDSSVSTGAGKTGLAWDTVGLTCKVMHPLNDGSALSVTLVGDANEDGTYTSGMFVAHGNASGAYVFGIPNTYIDGTYRIVDFLFSGAANMRPTILRVHVSIPTGAAESVSGDVDGDVAGDVNGKVLGSGVSSLVAAGVIASQQGTNFGRPGG